MCDQGHALRKQPRPSDDKRHQIGFTCRVDCLRCRTKHL